MPDIVTSLNKALAQFVIQLNKDLPNVIVGANLDPIADVASGDITLGEIKLGGKIDICTAKVIANYSVKDVVGLSSASIANITVATFDSSQAPTVTGDILFSAGVNALSAKLGGGITAKCGKLHDHVGISGKVTAEGLTGTGQGTYTATVGSFYPLNISLTGMELTSLSFNYDSIDAEIKHLGVFNKFLNSLIKTITDMFGSVIKSQIGSDLQPVLNKLIKNELPFNISNGDA